VDAVDLVDAVDIVAIVTINCHPAKQEFWTVPRTRLLATVYSSIA